MVLDRLFGAGTEVPALIEVVLERKAANLKTCGPMTASRPQQEQANEACSLRHHDNKPYKTSSQE